MLDNYHDKLVSDVKALFGDSLTTVQAYFPEDLAGTQEAGIVIDTPAALIEIETIDDAPEDELSDGRDGVLCSVTIHCILSTTTANLQRELWNFAAELMRGMRARDFGLHEENTAGRATDVTALPGRFSNGASGYDSRAVNFNQVVFLGDEKWDGLPADVQQVFWSLAPEIGAAHEGKYREVT